MKQYTEIKKYRSLLEKSALFRGLSDGEFEKTFAILCAEYRTYGKGEILHLPCTELKKFGMVLSGVVQACMDDVDGNRMIMADVVPGVTFGEAICFLRLKESPVYIYASEAAEILWFSCDAFFTENPDPLTLRLQKQFSAMLAARTLSMNGRIQVLSKIRLRDKLITYFSQLSQVNREYAFTIPMSRDDLATYLGTNRSALSRELSQMKKEGLIDFHRSKVKIIK